MPNERPDRHVEFRDQLQNALYNVGLFGQRIGNPGETVDLYSVLGKRQFPGFLTMICQSSELFGIQALLLQRSDQVAFGLLLDMAIFYRMKI